jgi:hypothetical protein
MPSEKKEPESPKWWIDQSRAGTEAKRGDDLPPAIARFYVTTKGYEQERARSGLVDTNLKLLTEANPEVGEFGYLSFIPERAPAEVIERIKRSLPLPENARAVIVDSGRAVRVIVTGTPVGERILEFNFNRGEPSFDAWIGADWKEEKVFRNLGELHRRSASLLGRYLSPEALAKRELFV